MQLRGWVVIGLMSALTLTGCASSDWETRYNELYEDLIDVTAERDQKQDEMFDVLNQNEALTQQVNLANREREELRRQATTAAQRAQEYADELARRERMSREAPTEPVVQTPVHDPSAELQTIHGMLQRLLDDDPNITGKVTPDGNIEITLPSDVTFGSGQSKLTSKGQQSLRSLSPALNGDYARYKIRVEGHTDNDPLKKTKKLYSDNFGLASARALSVVRFMENDLSIAPTRLESASRGEHAPLVPNTSKANKAKNRRVAIVVVIPRAEVIAEAMAK